MGVPDFLPATAEFAVESVGPAAVPGRAERFNHKPTRPTATLCGPSAACCVASRAIAELRGTAAGPAEKQLRLNGFWWLSPNFKLGASLSLEKLPRVIASCVF